MGGWTAEQFAERRMPTVAELNAAAPDTPVFVLHLYQSALMNRRRPGGRVHPRDPDPRGGQIVRNRDGEPNGVLLAAPSALILYSTLAKAPALDASGKRTSTRHFLRELNRWADLGGGRGGRVPAPTTTRPSSTWRAPEAVAADRLPPVPADGRAGARRPQALDGDGRARGRRRVAPPQRRG
ncbi:amidohydrolase family protein [Streptomyces cirratus]|uniref:amidohydrolase family protein n=1 Tax=Streptomyces cirratus TaxID=68187 RepID=UPI003620A00D